MSSSPSPTSRPAVAYVVTHYPRLSQTFVRNEVVGLRERGWPVSVFALNESEPSDLSTKADRDEQRSTVYLKAKPHRSLPPALFAAAKLAPGALVALLIACVRHGGLDLSAKVLRLFHTLEALIVWNACRKNGISHIHSQFGGSTATIALLATDFGRIAGGPSSHSMTIHGYTDFTNEPEIKLPAKLERASFVITISDFIRAQVLRQVHPRLWDRVHVARVGTDLSLFPRRSERSRSEDERPTILTVGRLSSEKGQIVLVQAVAHLKARGVDVNLDLVGDGPLRGELETLIGELDVNDRVHLLGARQPTEVAERLSKADIFCLPSFAEGIPVSIMEAMSIGVPVVSTNVMGIPELVVDGVTGRTVRPGRSDELADALQAVIADPDATNHVVSNAYAAVHKEHNLDTSIDRVADLLAQYVRTS